jgi:hypothetical protein
VLVPSEKSSAATRRNYCSPPRVIRRWPLLSTQNPWQEHSESNHRACNGSSLSPGWTRRRKSTNEPRLELLFKEPATAPHEKRGVLVREEHENCKWRKHTAHVGRQWLTNIGKTENGVVSLTSLLAEEGVHYPLEFEPYTPAHHFEDGKEDPEFRTKLKIAEDLVERSVHRGVRLGTVVADSFYGEDREFKHSLGELDVCVAWLDGTTRTIRTIDERNLGWPDTSIPTRSPTWKRL